MMQDFNIPNKEAIINEKLKSDEMLSKYKKNMLEAINMFQKYPNGLVIAGTAIIKCGKKVTFFISGENKDFKDQYPEYLLRWQLMDSFSKQGYKICEFNGMIGSFDKKDDDVTSKQEMSNKIVEYVGEFDLVINKKSYYTGNKLNPILNWLNTPI